eukprot:264648-Amphidinium_carterae.1
MHGEDGCADIRSNNYERKGNSYNKRCSPGCAAVSEFFLCVVVCAHRVTTVNGSLTRVWNPILHVT